MRLTVDLIQNSLSFLNPLKERELDLRGHKIPTIENLAAAGGQQDAIDLTDNDVASLSNLPLSPRLRTLLLARNRVSHIAPNIGDALPNLTVLVLTANNLAELADLDPLRRCVRLTHLSLLENSVTRKENYRLYLIWRLPSLRFLDFQKVRDAERESATSLFGTADAPTAAASKIMGIKSRAAINGSSADAGGDAAAGGEGAGALSAAGGGGGGGGRALRVQLTDEEKAHVQELIRNAKSLQEIARLEKALAEGRIPGGVRG